MDRSKVKEKILGENKRFLRGAGIAADRREELVCVGIVEGGTPCFVYRRKAEDLDPSPPSSVFFSFFFLIINIVFCIAVNSEMVMQMDTNLTLFK